MHYLVFLLKVCLLYTKILNDETELPLSDQPSASFGSGAGGSAGLEVELWIDLPPSSGLGGHGALTAALLSVLWRIIGKVASRSEIINVVSLCSICKQHLHCTSVFDLNGFDLIIIEGRSSFYINFNYVFIALSSLKFL